MIRYVLGLLRWQCELWPDCKLIYFLTMPIVPVLIALWIACEHWMARKMIFTKVPAPSVIPFVITPADVGRKCKVRGGWYAVIASYGGTEPHVKAVHHEQLMQLARWQYDNGLHSRKGQSRYDLIAFLD